ncbi:MAG TPA: flagellar biosynthesis protein FlhF [Deltaproteobacteria bacterium]|nr:flagellar biosynthesis protein FlhF [Deltaproteobacteria bacterium]HPR55688.1 flagellar biosynthesis protein FlhF [Deltaproteobacteria bacterium]
MKDALTQIKSELGSNAVIVSTREIKESGYGLMSRPLIEVVAAVDYDEDAFIKRMQGRKAQSGIQEGRIPAEPILPAPGHIGEEIVELKKMIKQLMSQGKVTPVHPLREKLVSRGIRENLTDLIFAKLGDESTEEDVKNLLSRLVRVEGPTDDRIRIFLGTTGVGKTTTIAKMAGRAVMSEGKRVALITLDSYRIGAIDQSRIYAKILNIPFFSVTTPLELKTAFNQLGSTDLILVDTVGRSPFCADYVRQLLGFFEGINACRFLLLPVATRDREMDTITKMFSPLKVDRMIFTKSDEAHTFGSIITHNMIHRTPVSYITTGQRVPEDIEPASREKIIARILGDA